MNLLQNRTYKRVGSVIACLGLLLGASVASARGAYQQSEPRFVDRGDQLEAFVEVRGLHRHRNVRVELDAQAEIELECRRWGDWYGRGYRDFGYAYAKQIDVIVEGTEWFSRYNVDYGRLGVRVETDDLERDFFRYYGYACAPGYRAYVRAVQFSNAKLEVRQGDREVVTWLCSFDRDTRNGAVPRSAVECVTLY